MKTVLDRADCADFGCHNSIRLETKHFLNTLALTFISFSGRFVFAMQKHYLFFASDPLVIFMIIPKNVNVLYFGRGSSDELEVARRSSQSTPRMSRARVRDASQDAATQQQHRAFGSLGNMEVHRVNRCVNRGITGNTGKIYKIGSDANEQSTLAKRGKFDENLFPIVKGRVLCTYNNLFMFF